MWVESRGNERAKGRRIEWLCQASDGSELTGTFVVLRLPTQKHERDVPGLPMTADELSNFKAVKPRHRHIEQHEVRRELRARSGFIDEIVHEAACPVIALLHAADPEFVTEAAKRGVFAYIDDDEPAAWRNAIEIVLLRFAEYHNLEGAFSRRALTERAKGILMERHSIGEAQAFELLRAQARSGNRKLVDIAQAVVDGHALLPKHT
jgi:hypothetical protein